MFFLFAIGLSVPLMAGRLKKAFEALGMHDYFKARELFRKEVNKNPAAAWYGLSVIVGRTDNPFYQLDSAFVFIQRADAAYASLADKKRAAYRSFGVDAGAILVQREHIYAIAWERAGALNTIEGYQLFMERFVSSSHVPEAAAARDALAFQEARALNTAEGYRIFLGAHPGAKETYEARNRMQEAVFREAAPNGTLAEYERFIADHPGSPYVVNAEAEIYRASTPGGTPEELMAFIRRYPRSPHVAEAWRGIYEARTKDLSVGSMMRFLKEYPDYPFVEELTEVFQTASLVLYPFRQNGKWGYIDAKGTERIKAIYEFAEPFEGGQAQVGRDGLAGTVNKMGKEVIAVEYDDVLGFSEGLATVERGDRAGVVDRSGKLVVGLEYDEVGEFSSGSAYAEKEGKFGYLDTKGAIAIPFIHDGANTFHNGVAVVQQGDLFGVIDTKGELVVPFQYEWVEGFVNAVSRVRKGGRTGVISPFGDVLLGVEHENVGTFSEGLAVVTDGGKCGYVDASGRLIVPQQYAQPQDAPPAWCDFHNGVARVMSAGKAGLVDRSGASVMPPRFVDIGLLECGAVPVKKKNKWGYADRAGNMLAEATHDGAWEMHEGFGRVRDAQLFGLVDSTGRSVLPVKYPTLTDVRGGHLIASDPGPGSGGRKGVIDVHGKILIPFAYDRIEYVDEATVLVGRGTGERITDMRMAYMRIAEGDYIWKEDGFDAVH